jgi:hypothetical protein
MTNLNASVKSRGVVLFAFNSDTVNYVEIAEQCARLIKHTLGLSITLITDTVSTSKYFDQTINVNNTLKNVRMGYAKGTQWRNGDRYRAYELSPYDETILIDSDYLMLDNSLVKFLNTATDYRLIHNNYSATHNMSGDMGPMSLNSVWATAIVFKRSKLTEQLFDLAGRIQHNYRYYRKLYQLREPNFRNDYAFAIANNVLSGYTTNINQSMPLTMLTLDKPVTNIEIKNSMLIIRERERAHVLPHQNIHVMDKEYLQSDDYKRFVNTICQN